MIRSIKFSILVLKRLMSMGQDTRSRLVRRHVLESQTPPFYFAPGDTNVFTGPCCWLYFLEGG
jgi:hypothetical protein